MGQGWATDFYLGHPRMFEVILGAHGASGTWDKAVKIHVLGRSRDVPGNLRYTWDIWDKTVNLALSWGMPGCPRHSHVLIGHLGQGTRMSN